MPKPGNQPRNFGNPKRGEFHTSNVSSMEPNPAILALEPKSRALTLIFDWDASMPANFKIRPHRASFPLRPVRGHCDVRHTNSYVIRVTRAGYGLTPDLELARYLQRASSGLNACWRQKTAP